VGLSYKMKMKNPEEINEGGDGNKDVRDEESEDLDTIRCKALFYKPAIYTNKTVNLKLERDRNSWEG